jgi:sporulation protein YlmC with PRC-barrel domain
LDPRLVNQLSELLGAHVRTQSGRRLGRVRDVRAELRPQTLAITGLVVGSFGLFERLGLGAPESRGRTMSVDVVPWRTVIRADSRGVLVRDET